MTKKDIAIGLILYKYFYRAVSETEIESELPSLLEMTDEELYNYRTLLVREKNAVTKYFQQNINQDIIKEGFKEVGIVYIERGDFDIIDYQEMIVHYLFNLFLPGHQIKLHFDSPTSGYLILNDDKIDFGV